MLFAKTAATQESTRGPDQAHKKPREPRYSRNPRGLAALMTPRLHPSRLEAEEANLSGYPYAFAALAPAIRPQLRVPCRQVPEPG